MSAPEAVEHIEGADSTGTVHLSIVPGGEVVDVRLEQNWRRTIGVAGLGAAVLEAIQAAGRAYTAGWAEALADVRREPVAAPRVLPKVEFDAASIHNALIMLEDLRRERKTRPKLDRNKVTNGTGASGNVTVTLRGRRVVDVLVEARWNGNHLETASELRSAFRSAYQQLPPLPDLTSGGSTTPSDPAEFIATLFGARR